MLQYGAAGPAPYAAVRRAGRVGLGRLDVKSFSQGWRNHQHSTAAAAQAAQAANCISADALHPSRPPAGGLPPSHRPPLLPLPLLHPDQRRPGAAAAQLGMHERWLRWLPLIACQPQLHSSLRRDKRRVCASASNNCGGNGRPCPDTCRCIQLPSHVCFCPTATGQADAQHPCCVSGTPHACSTDTHLSPRPAAAPAGSSAGPSCPRPDPESGSRAGRQCLPLGKGGREGGRKGRGRDGQSTAHDPAGQRQLRGSGCFSDHPFRQAPLQDNRRAPLWCWSSHSPAG